MLVPAWATTAGASTAWAADVGRIADLLRAATTALADANGADASAASQSSTWKAVSARSTCRSVADLRPLLNGTNLPAISGVFALLVRTDASPDLAPALLHDNGGWLLDHLGSEAPMASEIAHRLLVRLNGVRDLGRTRAAWEGWVHAL